MANDTPIPVFNPTPSPFLHQAWYFNGHYFFYPICRMADDYIGLACLVTVPNPSDKPRDWVVPANNQMSWRKATDEEFKNLPAIQSEQRLVYQL